MTRRFRGRRRDRIVAACPTGKRSYPTRQEAVKASHAARKVQPDPLYVYRHDDHDGCGQYHLTTQNPLWRYRKPEPHHHGPVCGYPMTGRCAEGLKEGMIR